MEGKNEDQVKIDKRGMSSMKIIQEKGDELEAV